MKKALGEGRGEGRGKDWQNDYSVVLALATGASWKLSPVSCSQLCPTLCDLLDCSPPGFSVHGIFSGKNTGVGCHSLLQGNLPHPGIEPISPASPALKVDSLPTEPSGKLTLLLL